MFAIREDREYVNQEDLTKAARKVGEAKKHESEYILLRLPLFISYHLSSQDGIFDVVAAAMYFTYLFLFLTMHFCHAPENIKAIINIQSIPEVYICSHYIILQLL